MFCKKCGNKLKKGVKFCDKCGTSITLDIKEKVIDAKGSSINLISLIKGLYLDPVKTVSDNVKYLKEGKVSLIASLILVLSSMIFKLLTTISQSFTVKTCDIWGKCKDTISLTNIFKLNYSDLVFKEVIILAILLFALSGIYYVGSLVLKKKIDFFEIHSVMICSLIPYVVLVYLISPILSSIYNPFGILIDNLVKVYTVLLISFSIKDLFKIKETKDLILLNSICLAVFTIIKYYAYL